MDHLFPKSTPNVKTDQQKLKVKEKDIKKKYMV